MPTTNANKANNPDNIPLVGINLIKQFESCELEAYPDPDTGNLPITIGWGSTRDFDGKPFKLGQKITQKYADELFAHQIKNEFIPALKKIPYWDQMNDNQRGALLSFAYNVGANFYGSPYFKTITEVLKSSRWNEVPGALSLYCNPGSDVEVGLTRRRKVEGDLWRK